MRLIGGGRLSFRNFGKRLYRAYQDDQLFDSAAQLSYYFLFSLFPFLFFLATLTAYLPIAGLVERLIPQLRVLAPIQVATFVEEHLRALTGEQRPRLLVLSLLASVFAASRGIDAIRRALNLAYDVKESRPLWRVELYSVGITIAGAASVLSGLALLVAGGDIGFWLAERLHVEKAYMLVVRQMRWPATGLLIASLVAVAYHLLPASAQRPVPAVWTPKDRPARRVLGIDMTSELEFPPGSSARASLGGRGRLGALRKHEQHRALGPDPLADGQPFGGLRGETMQEHEHRPACGGKRPKIRSGSRSRGDRTQRGYGRLLDGAGDMTGRAAADGSRDHQQTGDATVGSRGHIRRSGSKKGAGPISRGRRPLVQMAGSLPGSRSVTLP